MRAATLGWVVGLMVLGSVARAQNTEPACAMGYQSVLSYGPPGHGSGAYFETAKSTFEQKLGDGSYVRGYAITHQARDGAGRTMSEVAMNCQRGEDGVPRPQLSVNVYDPTTKTSLNWQVNGPFEKVAHVFHQPSPAPAAVKTLSAEQLALRKKAALALQKPCPVPGAGDGDLGTRMIAGVEAHGQRTTQTIPAGQEGNELPLVITHETWTSKELGLTLMGISDDPRRGKSTFEVEELTLGEPDAAVFAPPAGYRVVDVNPPAEGAAKQ